MKRTTLESFLSPNHGTIKLIEVRGEDYVYYIVLSADRKVCKSSVSRSRINMEFKALHNVTLNIQGW